MNINILIGILTPITIFAIILIIYVIKESEDLSELFRKISEFIHTPLICTFAGFLAGYAGVLLIKILTNQTQQIDINTFIRTTEYMISMITGITTGLITGIIIKIKEIKEKNQITLDSYKEGFYLHYNPEKHERLKRKYEKQGKYYIVKDTYKD